MMKNDKNTYKTNNHIKRYKTNMINMMTINQVKLSMTIIKQINSILNQMITKKQKITKKMTIKMIIIKAMLIKKLNNTIIIKLKICRILKKLYSMLNKRMMLNRQKNQNIIYKIKIKPQKIMRIILKSLRKLSKTSMNTQIKNNKSIKQQRTR